MTKRPACIDSPVGSNIVMGDPGQVFTFDNIDVADGVPGGDGGGDCPLVVSLDTKGISFGSLSVDENGVEASRQPGPALSWPPVMPAVLGQPNRPPHRLLLRPLCLTERLSIGSEWRPPPPHC